MSLQLRGTLLAALSGILYGCLGYLGTQLFHANFSVENMLFWRFAMAFLWILSCMLLFRRKELVAQKNHSALLKIFTLGAVYYSGSSALYFLATKHMGTGLAMVIFFTFPLFVTLLAWLFSDWRMNAQAFFALSAVMIGLYMLQGQEHQVITLLGFLFSLSAALSYALYIHSTRHIAQINDPWLLTLVICLGNALIFFFLAYKNNSLMLPASINNWLEVLAIGIIATAIPIQLLLTGLKYISPIKASILSVFEPLVTVVLGLVLLNESMSFLQVMGGFVVIIGAIIIQFERKPTLINE